MEMGKYPSHATVPLLTSLSLHLTRFRDIWDFPVVFRAISPEFTSMEEKRCISVEQLREERLMNSHIIIAASENHSSHLLLLSI
jgi:hypothetical protein